MVPRIDSSFREESFLFLERDVKMKEFKSLDKRKESEVEKDIASFWKKENIFEKSITNREGKEDFVFYDGPIYANAKPGIHHVLAKTLKDTFCKYKTMRG